jgi:hypothetical protein
MRAALLDPGKDAREVRLGIDEFAFVLGPHAAWFSRRFHPAPAIDASNDRCRRFTGFLA